MRRIAKQVIASSSEAASGTPLYISILSGFSGGVYTSWDAGTLFQDEAGTTPATANTHPVRRWNPVAGDVGPLQGSTANWTLQSVGDNPRVGSADVSSNMVASGVNNFLSSENFSVIWAFQGTSFAQHDVSGVVGWFDVKFWSGTQMRIQGVSPDFFSSDVVVPTTGSVVVEWRRTGGNQLAGRVGTGAWTNGAVTTEPLGNGRFVVIEHSAGQTATSVRYAMFFIDKLLTDGEFDTIRSEFLANMP